MKLLSDNLLNEFYDKMKLQYPNINLEQAKEICYGTWIFLKEEMENGELAEVRFKYLGTFKVYPKRVEKMLIKLKENFENFNNVEYVRIEKMLINFVNKYENKSNKL